MGFSMNQGLQGPLHGLQGESWVTVRIMGYRENHGLQGELLFKGVSWSPGLFSVAFYKLFIYGRKGN